MFYFNHMYIYHWQFFVTFLGWWKRDPFKWLSSDLQRSGMKFGHFVWITWQCWQDLGGGFKYFLFSPLDREDSHFDSYFSNELKPPTRRFVSCKPWCLGSHQVILSCRPFPQFLKSFGSRGPPGMSPCLPTKLGVRSTGRRRNSSGEFGVCVFKDGLKKGKWKKAGRKKTIYIYIYHECCFVLINVWNFGDFLVFCCLFLFSIWTVIEHGIMESLAMFVVLLVRRA